MANLEYVVRPYQTPNVYGQTIIPSTPTRANRATLTWGATVQGTVPAATEKPKANSMTYQFECCGEKLNETSRQVNRVRIDGSDGESWMDVERPKTMKLKRNTQQNCDSPLEQISWVNQGINEALGEIADAFATGETTATHDDCDTSWVFAI